MKPLRAIALLALLFPLTAKAQIGVYAGFSGAHLNSTTVFGPSSASTHKKAVCSCWVPMSEAPSSATTASSSTPEPSARVSHSTPSAFPSSPTSKPSSASPATTPATLPAPLISTTRSSAASTPRFFPVSTGASSSSTTAPSPAAPSAPPSSPPASSFDYPDPSCKPANELTPVRRTGSAPVFGTIPDVPPQRHPAYLVN